MYHQPPAKNTAWKVRSKPILTVLVVCLMLISCMPSTTTPATTMEAPSAWREPVTFGQAHRSGPPAVQPSGSGWAVAWAEGSALYYGTINPDGMPGEQVTVLLGNMPWGPVLLPAKDLTWHLFWRDLNTFGEVQLYNAIIDAEGSLIRGPITTVSEPVSDIAIIPVRRQGAAVLWTNVAKRPTLYGQRVDGDGRPAGGAPVEIVSGATNARVARTNDGTWILAWLALPDSALSPADSRTLIVRASGGDYPWESRDTPRAVLRAALPREGSYLENTALGLDETHGYYFIGQRNAATDSGTTTAIVFDLARTDETSAHIIEVTGFSGVLSTSATPPTIDTGFSTGPVYAVPAQKTVQQTAISVSWPVPAVSQHAFLPVAISSGQSVGIVYFQGGAAAGFETVVPDGSPMTGTGLAINDDGFLALVWAERPASQGQPALLQWTTSQGLSVNQ